MAAKWVDEFNSGAGHGCAARFANVRRVCEEIGRDPSSLRMSATAQVICGSTKTEARQRLERLAGEGCETIYLHIFDIDDLDHLALIGSEVIPQVA